MNRLNDAIRAELDAATQAWDRDEWEANAKLFRFAWAEGHETLYKFKSLAAGACHEVFDIIENSRIYFSSPSQFNDPLDCSPVYKLARDVTDPAFIDELWLVEERLLVEKGTPKEELSRLRAEFPQHIPGMPLAVQDKIRQGLEEDTRIFCLSAQQCHPLQWAHYAAGHTGVCLHFKCKRTTVFGLARAVIYQEDRPQLLLPLELNKDFELAMGMVGTKALFWGYEEEYRIIADNEGKWGHTLKGRFCDFDPELLIGITLGMSISASDRGMVREWSRNRNPPLRIFRAVENSKRYWMDIESVESI